MKPYIAYGMGDYLYELKEDYSIQTPIVCMAGQVPGFVELAQDGLLSIKAGYSWDGPSGPAVDTPDFMRGSLVHDALYQLMRERKLPQECRPVADEILRDICLEDGMSRVRAWYVYWAVRLFAAGAAKAKLS